ncbi:MarR family winged helix-turn-helix transcriptional regulator [Seleniivibrio woodruffii]|uniref:MarR family transcriptional regulator n=1 Tax=Seleniivibrio woodruffii TaxID=1078050 RepID=A0A4R1KF50_9BACT|nr:MarR family transcriptional regulator [Seleniivibrio woodruffii]TCK62653.1 MarR family transcriptional regulator [Seleniivibrio woodruffii]TVZ36921.1 MarR family 2-MHQ and catechol resistance regulon transcriptional repressor [Seleniivibrio woodruffii]
MKDKTIEQELSSLDTFIKLVQTAENVSACVYAHLKDFGITVSQFGVLEALYTKGAMCQKDIAEIIRKTTGNMTTVIDNLEKNGLAERKKDQSDRRFFTVSITDKGMDVLNMVFDRYKNNVEQVMKDLDAEDRQNLVSILGKLRY